MIRLFIIITFVLSFETVTAVTARRMGQILFTQSPAKTCRIAIQMWHRMKLNNKHSQLNSKQRHQREVRRALNSPKRPIQEFPEAARFLLCNRIFVSLSTSPKRIKFLHYTLQTLDLTHVEKIFLTLPRRFGRDGSSYGEIPLQLVDFPKLEILWVEKDIGPATKVIPALEKLQSEEAEGLLISIDDDVSYTGGMINELILAAALKRDTVINGLGKKYEDYGIDKKSSHSGSEKYREYGLSMKPVDIVQGYRAIAYPLNLPRQFPEFVRDLIMLDKSVYNSDDLSLSMALEYLGIPRYGIESRFFRDRMNIPFPHSFGEDSLISMAPREDRNQPSHSLNYQKAYRQIRRYFAAHHTQIAENTWPEANMAETPAP